MCVKKNKKNTITESSLTLLVCLFVCSFIYLFIINIIITIIGFFKKNYFLLIPLKNIHAVFGN